MAEGVEDAPTLERLRELGCDIAQGYHFSRPVPAEEFTVFVATHDRESSRWEAHELLDGWIGPTPIELDVTTD